MNNNYKIIRTIFENTFQRVMECKIEETGEIFYSNIITSQKVINLMDIQRLKTLPSNILEAYNTDDRVYIYTKPLNDIYKGLGECISDSLTLKQQFSLSENAILLAQDIFNMTDVVQQKILDINKIFTDDHNNLFVDLNLIFEQEYDIADNETFKRLGNIIHFIFSGTEIIDYNISDTIPPDVLKIIVRCLTKEYIFPKDALDELKNSPIYTMINGLEETAAPADKEKKPEQTPVITVSNEEGAGTDDENSVLNIYLNEDSSTQKVVKKPPFLKKELPRILVSFLIVIVVLLAGNKIIKMFNGKAVSDDNPSNDIQDKPSVGNPEKPEPDNSEKSMDEITDSTESYFNDKLLEKIGYSGTKAALDYDIYVEGKNSLLINNEDEGSVKSLFAAIDFTDDKFSYMLKQQIGITAKIKSEKDVKVMIVLEAYKDGKLASNFHTKIDSYDDMWSTFSIPINVTNADSLNIYVEYEGKNKVWIDSIYIDVIK